jgi:hypothetical protein
MVSFIRITKYHFIQVPCIRLIDATLFLRLYDRYMLLYYQYHASMLHETYNCKYMELITGLRVVALVTNRFISNLCILVFWTVCQICVYVLTTLLGILDIIVLLYFQHSVHNFKHPRYIRHWSLCTTCTYSMLDFTFNKAKVSFSMESENLIIAWSLVTVGTYSATVLLLENQLLVSCWIMILVKHNCSFPLLNQRMVIPHLPLDQHEVTLSPALQFNLLLCQATTGHRFSMQAFPQSVQERQPRARGHPLLLH